MPRTSSLYTKVKPRMKELKTKALAAGLVRVDLANQSLRAGFRRVAYATPLGDAAVTVGNTPDPSFYVLTARDVPHVFTTTSHWYDTASDAIHACVIGKHSSTIRRNIKTRNGIVALLKKHGFTDTDQKRMRCAAQGLEAEFDNHDMLAILRNGRQVTRILGHRRIKLFLVNHAAALSHRKPALDALLAAGFEPNLNEQLEITSYTRSAFDNTYTAVEKLTEDGNEYIRIQHEEHTTDVLSVSTATIARDPSKLAKEVNATLLFHNDINKNTETLKARVKEVAGPSATCGEKSYAYIYKNRLCLKLQVSFNSVDEHAEGDAVNLDFDACIPLDPHKSVFVDYYMRCGGKSLRLAVKLAEVIERTLGELPRKNIHPCLENPYI